MRWSPLLGGVTGSFMAAICAGCSMTTVGVIPFHGVGVSATQVMIDARSEVRFWTELDGMYGPGSGARYDIDLLQDDKVVASTTCDPIVVHDSVRVCTLRGWFSGVYKTHCRMRCRATVPRSGLTIVRARFSTPGPSAPRRIDSAGLTIEQ
ncbi:MAG TPA: hypothetical protein VGP64_05280 [Polyangia bacterium]